MLVIHKALAGRRIKTRSSTSVQRSIQDSMHIVGTRKMLKNAAKQDDEKPSEECWEACKFETLLNVYQNLGHEGKGIYDHQNSDMQRHKMNFELCRAFLPLFYLTNEKEGMKIFKVFDSNFSVSEDFIQNYKAVEHMQ